MISHVQSSAKNRATMSSGTLLEIAMWWISASAKIISTGPRSSSDMRSRRCQPAEQPGVRAQVPDRARLHLLDPLGDHLLLVLQPGRAIAVALVVVRPVGAARVPVQLFDPALQAVKHADQRIAAHP